LATADIYFNKLWLLFIMVIYRSVLELFIDAGKSHPRSAKRFVHWMEIKDQHPKTKILGIITGITSIHDTDNWFVMLLYFTFTNVRIFSNTFGNEWEHGPTTWSHSS
jgi:hypothetical protein